MCPSPPSLPIEDISTYWTDEELFKSLKRMIHGSTPPGNVIEDTNPCQHKPSNLPDNVWYFIRTEGKKDSEFGIWKAKGEACGIFTNSDITGWRTTYEFYEGQGPRGCKTDWVMQEYRITQKGMHGNSSSKDSSSLCRVFLSSGQSSNNGMQHNLVGEDVAGSGNYIRSITGQGSTSNSQVNSGNDETKPLPVTENRREIDYAISGDFLELRDLDNSPTPSSSENSSFRSMTSDDYFDSSAFLRELGPEDKKDMQQKNADHKFNVLASVRPKEVVLHPATAGSVISDNGNKSPAEALKTDCSLPAVEQKTHDKVFNLAIGTHKIENNNEGSLSNSHNVVASSAGHKPALDGEKETASGKHKKAKKNFFCFLFCL